MSELIVERKGWLTDLVLDVVAAQDARLIIRGESVVCVSTDQEDLFSMAAPGRVTGFVGSGGEVRDWAPAAANVAVPFHEFAVHPTIPLQAVGKYVRLLGVKDVDQLRQSLRTFGIMSLVMTHDEACRALVPKADWMVRLFRQYAQWDQADEEPRGDLKDKDGRVTSLAHQGILAGFAAHECASVFGVSSGKRK